MSTLFSQASQAIPVGTYNFGPFALPAGQSVTALITPSTWPSSGQVVEFTYTFSPSGQGGGGGWSGGAMPTLKNSNPGFAAAIQWGGADTQVSLQVVVSQQFTAAILVTTP